MKKDKGSKKGEINKRFFNRKRGAVASIGLTTISSVPLPEQSSDEECSANHIDRQEVLYDDGHSTDTSVMGSDMDVTVSCIDLDDDDQGEDT